MDMNYDIKVWRGEKLGSVLAVDTETDLQPFHTRNHTLVTCQVYNGSDNVYFVETKDLRKFFNLHAESYLVMQNATFDVGVLSKYTGTRLWYNRYDKNKIRDTKILFKLYNLAVTGEVGYKSSLKHICKTLLGRDIDKDEAVRCTFDQFLGWSIGDIPEQHLRYAAEDAIHTYDAYMKLLNHISDHDKYNTLLSHDIQVKGDWALDCIYKNGIGFDLKAKSLLVEEATKKLDQLQDRLAMWGYVRGKPGINDVFEEILKNLGIFDDLPKTETGKVSKASEDLETFDNIPFIKDYLEFNYLEKAISFIKNIHSSRIHPKYNVLLNTGRTSCSKGDGAVNVQQLPRLGGIRECFIPEEGKEFYIIDYSGMENVMLAQELLHRYGSSKMADALNEGMDIHKYYATTLFSKDIDEVTKDERQQAKAAVFGIPGGLGIETFMKFAKGYGLTLTPSRAAEMKEAYFKAFPEMRKYLSDIDEGDVFTRSGRKRGNASYCAVANTPFQGSGADMAKIAMYNLTKAGFKIVAFIHDEFIIEIDKKEDRYEEACNIMVESGKEVAPDVLLEVEGGRSEKWVKM